MMKRIFLMPAILALVSALLFGGCAAPAPAPAPAPPPEKPIELKYSTYIPPVVWFYEPIIMSWTKEIEERTNGRVKITVFPAESLGKVHDHYSMVLSRHADICQIDIGATPGVFPLSEGIALPLIFKTTEAACGTWHELAEKYLMDTELKEVKVLWFQVIAPTHIFTVKKPVHTLEDLAGMKLGSTQEVRIKTLKKLGATPVFTPITEVYTALDRGVIDGHVENWEAAVAFKFMEVTKYRTAVSLDTSLTMVVMNLDAWNSLPPDIQRIFEETTGLEMSQRFGAGFDEVEKDVLAHVLIPYDRDKGNPEIYYLPEDEKARWSEVVAPVYEEWIAEREGKGLPARAFFNDMLEIAAKYHK